MKQKSSVILLITFSMLSIFLLSLTAAQIAMFINGANTTNNGTNFSTSIIVNVTFVNGTDIMIANNVSVISSINATFWYNGTHGQGANGNLTILNRTTTCGAVNASDNVYACWANVTISGFTDGLYNITVTLYNGSGASTNATAINSTFIRAVRFDSTKPQVAAANITNINDGYNFSSIRNGTAIVINISIFDAGIGVSHVFLNITNSTGKQNLTITATREDQDCATTSRCAYNATFNSAIFLSGKYNITIYVNDSVAGNGNVNSSAARTSLTFDNTAPTVTLSCTPNPVEQGDTLTCTCSNSDDFIGLNSSTQTYTANPSTANSGGFSTTCSIADLLSNSGSASFSYTVASGAGSSGGSSGGGGGSSGSAASITINAGQTTVATEAQISNGFSAKFATNSAVTFTIVTSSASKTQHTIKITKIESNKATVVISSDPITLSLALGESKDVDVDGDGKSDMNVKLNSISGGKADVTIKQIAPTTAAGTTEGATEPETPSLAPEDTGSSSKSKTIIWVVIVLVILVIIGVVWKMKAGKKSKY